MHNRFFVYIKSSRQSLNTDKLQSADLVFIHKVGSNFHGTVIKDRGGWFGMDKYTHIDRLRLLASGLPRKKKKRITSAIDAQVRKYKRDF